MAPQLLFYRRVTPVSAQRHAKWCVEAAGDFAFARNVNSVPLMAVEIPQASREYTIMFVRAEATIMPVALLGVQENENLYVTDTGGWDARYVPAFVRRYPFVFSRSNQQDANFTLCIDEAWTGCNENGTGQALFDKEGKRTPYLENVLGFLQEYHVHIERTRAFCDRLAEYELLEPMQAQFNLPGKQRQSLVGFLAVNRSRLKALSDDKLARLVKSDELELTYLHMQSMNNFRFLTERAAKRRGEATNETDALAPVEEPKMTSSGKA